MSSNPPPYSPVAPTSPLPLRPPQPTDSPTKPASRPLNPIPRPLQTPLLSSLRSSRVILASSSPRRRQLLSSLQIPFEVIPSDFPEDLDKRSDPFDYVFRTSQEKAIAVYKSEVIKTAAALEAGKEKVRDPDVVISADTIIFSSQGQIFEKPTSPQAHLAMLRSCRAAPHSVLTAVSVLSPLESAVAPGYYMDTVVEEAKVYFFKDLSDDELKAYIDSGEGRDKAGGYAIQGLGGSVLVEKIEGNYQTVVGLPVGQTLRLVNKVVEQARRTGVQGLDDGEVDSEEESLLE